MSCLTPNLLASFEAGTLEDAALASAREHLDACSSCKERHQELVATAKLLAKPDFGEAAPSPDTWRAIEETLRAENAPRAAVTVSVACTFCKGGLKRKEAVYCAACIAPHHSDCWEEHGRCASCAVTQLVRPEVARTTPRRSFAKPILAAGIAALFGSGAVAALLFESHSERERALERARAAEERRIEDTIETQKKINQQLEEKNRLEKELYWAEREGKQKLEDANTAKSQAQNELAAASAKNADLRRQLTEAQAKLDVLKRASVSPGTEAERQACIDELMSRILDLEAALAEKPKPAQTTHVPPAKQASEAPKVPDNAPSRTEALTADEAAEVAKLVDFSKPPADVVALEKCRMVVKGTRNAKNELSLVVTGAAYYPNGTKYFLRVRHPKVSETFALVSVIVQKHAFKATIGPIKGTMPAGGLVVDAHFMFTLQSFAIQSAIMKGDADSNLRPYFHCPNGCVYDRENLVTARLDTGGPSAESKDEELEKREFATARAALMDARAACKPLLIAGSLDAIAKAERGTADALAAFSKWEATRAFLLFPKHAEQLETIAWLIVNEVKATFRESGVILPPERQAPDGTTAERLQKAPPKDASAMGKGIEEALDLLQRFLDDKHALDNEWKAFEKASRGDPARLASPEDEKAYHARLVKQSGGSVEGLDEQERAVRAKEPVDFPSARARYEQAKFLLMIAKDTSFERSMALLVRDTKDDMVRFAPSVAGKVLARKAELESQKKLLEARDALDDFPDELENTLSGEQIKKERERLDALLDRK